MIANQLLNGVIIHVNFYHYQYHNLVPGPGHHVQNKILNIHVLLIHVSETYNTIMSLHVLGKSVDVHIELFDNSVKISC